MIIVPSADIAPDDLGGLQKQLKELGITAHPAGCPERPVLLAPGVTAGKPLLRSLKELGTVEQVIPEESGAEPMNLISRRTFLDYSIATGAAIAAGAGLWGAVTFARPPRTARRNADEAFVSASRLKNTPSVSFEMGDTTGVLVRHKGKLYALSSTCTHRWTCRVQYDPRSNQLVCPCHNGVFDLQGNVVSGPPPTPLTRFQVARINGHIHIRR